MFQLPPVKASPIFSKGKSSEEYFESSVWELFKINEFQQVMRQKDEHFIKTLLNCATSNMTDKDVELIQKRIVKNEIDVLKDVNSS